MINSSEQLAVVKFGKSWTGKDPYYEIVNEDDTIIVTRTNSNVVEHGDGAYSVDLALLNLPSQLKGVIKWDDGDSPIGRTACEDISIGYANITYDGEGN